MSFIDKKQKEKETADFFKQWYSNACKKNYEAVKDPEDRDCDYLLVPEAKDEEEIRLQITTCDHAPIKSCLEAMRTPGEVLPAFDMDHDKNISKMILDKGRTYPSAVQENLILLVYSDFAKFNATYLQDKIKENCTNNNFKGIYLVELPRLDPKKSYPLYEGNVIKLK